MSMTDAIVTLATLPAILALVELAKRTGLPTKAAPWLAIALGITLATTDNLLAAWPAYQAASSGLLLGLGAAGVYDAAKTASQKASSVQITNITPTDTPGVVSIANPNASATAADDIGLPPQRVEDSPPETC